MVSPDQDAEEADQQRRGDHDAVAEDAAAREVGQQHRHQPHPRQNGDVDLGMSEEPEEVQPQQRGTIAAAGMQGSVDQVACGEEEAGVGMPVRRQQQQRSE